MHNLNLINTGESKCRKGNWSKEDECMINNQISIEFNAFHIYNFLYSTAFHQLVEFSKHLLSQFSIAFLIESSAKTEQCNFIGGN